MKWHRLFLTITAAVAITLPFQSQGEYCNVETWNKALKYQRKVDDWYNVQATEFNLLLKTYQRQVFLHQEFRQQELEMLFRSEKQNLRKMLDQQIQASRSVITELERRSTQINTDVDMVQSALTRWHLLSQTCEQEHQLANTATSLGYVKTNRELQAEVTRLLTKIQTITAMYQREADILTIHQNAHQMASKENKGK